MVTAVSIIGCEFRIVCSNDLTISDHHGHFAAVIQPKTKMRNIANPNIFDSARFLFFLNFATKFS